MIYVGIDIAKHTHVAAVINSDGEVLFEPFSFNNDIVGFSLLTERLSGLDKSSLLVGMESTAHYCENLLYFLRKAGFQVVMLNPITTSAIRRSAIRKIKTDSVDSLAICKALAIYGYKPSVEIKPDYKALKELCNARQNLILLRSRAKIQLSTYVDQLFPELNSFFRSGIHIKTSYALLKHHCEPCRIKNLHLTYLSNLLIKTSKGKYTKEDAVALKVLAANSVGVPNHFLSLHIAQNIELIELLNKQLKEVETLISSAMQSLNSKILTIPGIGNINGAMILSSIGDISRFNSSSKLIAFAGIDPTVNQSGKFTARKTRMSKRGSPMLRYALINAAHNVVKYNRTFSDYYCLKISQGKSHYCALGHTAGKLARVIFTILSREIDFNLA